MARIRSIKPDHGTNKKVGKLSDRAYRIWMTGLLSQADDEGRLSIDFEELKVKAYAYFPKVSLKSVTEAVAEIFHIGLIDIGLVEDRLIVQLHDWEDHQSISHPQKSRLPKIGPIPERSGVFQNILERSIGKEGRMEGGMERKEGDKRKDTASLPLLITFQRPTPELVTDYAASIQFKLDGRQFVDYYESKGWVVGRSPMKDWRAAVRTWKQRSLAPAMAAKPTDRERWLRAGKTFCHTARVIEDEKKRLICQECHEVQTSVVW